MTYPNGRDIYYDYGVAGGLDDRIGRLAALVGDDGVTAMESFAYLGLGSVVERGHAQTGVDLTYVGTGGGDAGDQYNGLDRFGRVVGKPEGGRKFFLFLDSSDTTSAGTHQVKFTFDQLGRKLTE